MLWMSFSYGIRIGVAHISLSSVWGYRCRYHAVLKCLGICTDGIHTSLCIVWVVSVLVLLDVIPWVRVSVFVYVL